MRKAYEVGRTVQWQEWRGRMVAIESDATIRCTNDGRVRVPNRLLLESVVRIHGGDEPEGAAPPR